MQADVTTPAPGQTVRHILCPDLGVGIVREVLQPDVVEVKWQKCLPDSTRRLFGHYRSVNLRPA